MESLFEIKNGNARITDHTRTIWQLNDFIERYGENVACKIFIVLHYMADLSIANPFKDLSEFAKLEAIVSKVAPETEIEVDWNSYEIIDAIEIVRELYSTQSYRFYLAKKDVLDRAIETIKHTPLDASKEFGNADQIAKWDKYIQDAMKSTREAYKTFQEEQGAITVRGRGQQDQNSISDKEIELE